MGRACIATLSKYTYNEIVIVSERLKLYIRNVMAKYDKLIRKILDGLSDANINFNDIRNLLISLGFEERRRGSHHLFRKEGVSEKINLQKDGNKAKPYQIKQIRKILIKYKLGSR